MIRRWVALHLEPALLAVGIAAAIVAAYLLIERADRKQRGKQ